MLTAGVREYVKNLSAGLREYVRKLLAVLSAGLREYVWKLLHVLKAGLREYVRKVLVVLDDSIAIKYYGTKTVRTFVFNILLISRATLVHVVT